MSITRRPIISTQILAGRQPFTDGVFAIGPFATRVSFSSQQRRAFAVVSEMDDDLRRSGKKAGLKGCDVCIVGAGLAGLSCALAVAAYGGTAFIYEAQPRRRNATDDLDSAMPTTRNARHRIGHPSLNFWPWEDLDPITRFPALNWFEAACPDIANAIAEEYRRFRDDEEFGERLPGIRFGCTVTEIKPSATQGKWEVEVRQAPDASEPWEVEFDIVLLAVGFGPEEGASVPTPSYWDGESDLVEAVRELSSSGFENFIVSGAGDGGLIEALRLLFRPMRAGGPTENFLQILRGERLRQEVANAEYQLSKRQSDLMIHDGGLDSAAAANQKRDELSNEVWGKYAALVKSRLTQEFINALVHARTPVSKVILTGLRPSPLELSSAPYHRILIAAAIGMGWAEYWQVTRDSEFTPSRHVDLGDKGRWESTQFRCTRVRRIYRGAVAGQQLKFAMDDAQSPETADACFFMARYGPHSDGALRHIFSDPNVIAQFKRQQALYADQDLLKDQHVEALSRLLRTPNPLDPIVFAKNTALIDRYFQSLGFASSFKQKLEGGEIHLTLLQGAPSQSVAPLPKNIWGLPVYPPAPPMRFDASGAPP